MTSAMTGILNISLCVLNCTVDFMNPETEQRSSNSTLAVIPGAIGPGRKNGNNDISRGNSAVNT